MLCAFKILLYLSSTGGWVHVYIQTRTISENTLWLDTKLCLDQKKLNLYCISTFEISTRLWSQIVQHELIAHEFHILLRALTDHVFTLLCWERSCSNCYKVHYYYSVFDRQLYICQSNLFLIIYNFLYCAHKSLEIYKSIVILHLAICRVIMLAS